MEYEIIIVTPPDKFEHKYNSSIAPIVGDIIDISKSVDGIGHEDFLVEQRLLSSCTPNKMVVVCKKVSYYKIDK